MELYLAARADLRKRRPRRREIRLQWLGQKETNSHNVMELISVINKQQLC